MYYSIKAKRMLIQKLFYHIMFGGRVRKTPSFFRRVNNWIPFSICSLAWLSSSYCQRCYLLYSGLSFLGGAEGTMAPPDFGRSVNPQPRGTDYAHQIILAPPDFQTFRRPWYFRLKRLLARYTSEHGLRTPIEGINQRNLKCILLWTTDAWWAQWVIIVHKRA